MIYFDNAATSFPKPKEVYDGLLEASTEFAANPGRSGHELSLKMDRAIFSSRAKISKFLGGSNPLHLIFTLNCTDSLNIAIKGLINKGDHVITTSLEHNSVLRPLNQLKEKGIIDLSIVYADKNGILDPKEIESAIKDTTKLVVTTAMSNLIGSIVDVTAIGNICRKHKLTYIVDAAQAMGYLDFDMSTMPIDVICFPGHKSLYGPMGTGGLYFQDNIDIKALKEGGTGSHSQELEQPSEYPDRLEAGTINGPGVYALAKGIDFINNQGLEKIREHENQLKNYFIKGMENIEGLIVYGPKDDRQGPVVSVNIENMDSSQLAQLLDEKYGIATRAGLHCAPLAHKTLGTEDIGAVRFSFGYFNTIEEVDTAIEALKYFASQVKNGSI